VATYAAQPCVKDTDIEVTSGLTEGDQIVTGTYKVIRTLRNSAKVKVENSKPASATKSES